MIGLEKLKLLFTIVDRIYAQKYIKKYEEYEVVMQTSFLGQGTAKKEILEVLGIDGGEKAVIISFVKESKVYDLLADLKEELKDRGKGIAFTVPIDSIIGKTVYSFLAKDKSLTSKGAK